MRTGPERSSTAGTRTRTTTPPDRRRRTRRPGRKDEGSALGAAARVGRPTASARAAARAAWADIHAVQPARASCHATAPAKQHERQRGQQFDAGLAVLGCRATGHGPTFPRGP